MPRQNRVDPFGAIVAHPAYGMLMGNRGCLHDNLGNIVRTSARDAWISCLPRWSGVRRKLMAPGQYTELFFLDEATAMAAGHRPCGSCRPQALAAFKFAWQRGSGLPNLPRVAEIDATLRSTECHEQTGIDGLPDGAMIVVADQPLLKWGGDWLAWTFEGYGSPQANNLLNPTVLTPPPMLHTLRNGYAPTVHLTATAAGREDAGN